MDPLHQFAQLLIASWRLGTSEDQIPTSHGLLDQALKSLCEAGAFPPWARRSLHFSDSRIGLQCVELPAILDWAQRAELTTAPNPSYQFAEICVSKAVAKRLLEKLGVAENDATMWGRALAGDLEQAKIKVGGREPASVER